MFGKLNPREKQNRLQQIYCPHHLLEPEEGIIVLIPTLHWSFGGFQLGEISQARFREQGVMPCDTHQLNLTAQGLEDGVKAWCYTRCDALETLWF